MKKIIFLTFTAIAISASLLLYAKSARFRHLDTFNKVLYIIENQYYRPVDVEKLIAGAIRGMVSTLDPHSTFLNEKLFSKLKEDTEGEFGGIGIEVTIKEGIIIISTPIDDSPASKAGLLSGDRIIEINHESIVGLSLEEAVDKMRGKVGSKVTLGIQRKGVAGIQHFTLKRKIIKIKPIKSHLIENKFLYIRLSQFQQKSYTSMVKTIKKYKKKTQGIVLDLRYNPGGLLDQAVDISSIFLRDGVVVYTEGRNPKDKEFYYVKKSGYKELSIPLVVLINGASASASEIVAAALQDSKRALIMGSTSFGKGSVQYVAPINEKSAIKLTIRQYMTPLGKRIQAIGIKPDIFTAEHNVLSLEQDGDDRFIREKDLRGHLTATIETKRERKERIQRERKERKERIQRVKERESSKKVADERQILPNQPGYKPERDYQVVQAVNYIKGHNALKKKSKQ